MLAPTGVRVNPARAGVEWRVMTSPFFSRHAAPYLRRDVLGGAAAAGLFAACGGGRRGPVRSSKLEVVAATDPELERAMGERVNRDRAAKGLPPLAYDEALADIARYHANDMHQHRFFAHDSPTSGSLDDRMAAAGYLASVARENLAEAPNVDQAEDGLLASPGHHANLMAKDITHLGVGIVRGGLADADNLLFVQVFASPLDTQSPEEAVGQALERIREAREARRLPPLGTHALLESIAAKNVEGLSENIAKGDMSPVAQAVVKDVEAAKARDVQSVTVAGTLMLHASMFEPPAAALAPDARMLGCAAAEAEDPKGRRALVLLCVVGR
jgi:hypothetical protein